MQQTDFDAVVVGAGFAGLYMLHKLRQMGLRVRVYDAAGGVGGTWYWNRYPGARCDIESMQYSYGFDEALQQEWTWSERYAPQPEILRYAEHVADRFDLRRNIQLNTKVLSAVFDDAANNWTVETDRGDRVTARFVVMATGNLSTAKTPPLPGQERFAGAVYHTGQWPHEGVDFTGKRVGIIGTGSSAVQAIPLIAKQAASLTVFQRTPNFVVPARNRPLEPDEIAAMKADYAGQRKRMRQASAGYTVQPALKPARDATPEEREAAYTARWAVGGFSFLYAFNDTLLNQGSNDAASSFIRARLNEVVTDPAVAERLTPKITLGCKRLCIDTGYWETFNRPNVSLVDINETPIERMNEQGIVLGDGSEVELDALIFATGFDAMTGTLMRIDIRGRDGVALKDRWAEGPSAYLGIGVAGFPNLFLITGPGSPGVLTNVITSIEHHVEFIADAIATLGSRGQLTIEPTMEAEEAWVAHVQEVADTSLRSACASWFLGPEVAGKRRRFMPYAAKFPIYVGEVEAIVAKGYEGFAFH